MVVEGEERFDILPLALLGCDASTTFVGRVYDTQAFGFVEGLCLKGFPRLFLGGGRADAVHPVVDSASRQHVFDPTIAGFSP
jgi:hypothetical protein